LNLRRFLLRPEPAAAAGPASHVPIFLHGGWRCGSTYIWSKFRQTGNSICFYEPFHEVLARCTPKKIRRDTASGWNSRHPALDRPYRDEYLPLLGMRGLRGYREDFALACYFPRPSGEVPELQYLSRLLRHAQRTGKGAVLGFSRSLARAAAMRAALGGYHVVIRRNPVQQWLSCRSYRVNDGSVYFELCHFLILALAAPDSTAGRFARGLGLPRPPRGRFRHQFEGLRDALWPWSDELSYQVFSAVNQLSHAIAEPDADLVIDVDRLSRAPEYRAMIQTALREHTGLAIDFHDCQVRMHDVDAVPVDFAAIESEVTHALRDLDSTCAPTVATFG